MKKIYWLLLAIIAFGLFFRLYNIGLADVITDEALIAIRSIGYIDFFVSPYQTTPYEWFSDIPLWAKLSFHDHPPLVFLIQNLSFKIFGINIFGLRLPFVLAGLFSIYFMYLIGQKLFDKKIGLLASLFLSVSCYHIWISRIGLQESIVICLSLLAFYLFIKAIESGNYWQWGIVLGLAFLTKYTSFILLPIFFIYLLIYKRFVFKDKRFYFGLLIALIIFSPVIIYNLKLYQARGHFDLQFSYLFNQQVDEWQFLPGKIQAGSFLNRLFNLIPSLYLGLLWPMFISVVVSVFYAVYYFYKTKNKNILLILLTIAFYLISFLLTGPMKRFVVTLVPFLFLILAWFIINQKSKAIKYILVFILVTSEIFFSFNTLLVDYPIGKQGIAYSYLKTESYSWGYNQLDNYLTQLLKDKTPSVTFTTKYQFLENIKEKALANDKQKNLENKGFLLIYDANMFDLATLWIFHRRLIYQGWPVITVDTYLSQNKDFWISQGVSNFYFFKIADSKILQQPELNKTSAAVQLASKLKVNPEIIKRPDGREVFEVYSWQ